MTDENQQQQADTESLDCPICHESFTTRDGYERPEICDDCAQEQYVVLKANIKGACAELDASIDRTTFNCPEQHVRWFLKHIETALKILNQ